MYNKMKNSAPIMSYSFTFNPKFVNMCTFQVGFIGKKLKKFIWKQKVYTCQNGTIIMYGSHLSIQGPDIIYDNLNVDRECNRGSNSGQQTLKSDEATMTLVLTDRPVGNVIWIKSNNEYNLNKICNTIHNSLMELCAAADGWARYYVGSPYLVEVTYVNP